MLFESWQTILAQETKEFEEALSEIEKDGFEVYDKLLPERKHDGYAKVKGLEGFWKIQAIGRFQHDHNATSSQSVRVEYAGKLGSTTNAQVTIETSQLRFIFKKVKRVTAILTTLTRFLAACSLDLNVTWSYQLIHRRKVYEPAMTTNVVLGGSFKDLGRLQRFKCDSASFDISLDVEGGGDFFEDIPTDSDSTNAIIVTFIEHSEISIPREARKILDDIVNLPFGTGIEKIEHALRGKNSTKNFGI